FFYSITPRKTDLVPVDANDSSSLTLCHRSPRTSLTFRLIRNGECNCEYKKQCDSQITSSLSTKELVNEDEAKELENKYVNQVYEEIAEHFSVTRYKPWPKVASFLSSIPSGSLILDVGCGNGKNMKLSSNCYEIGCDASCNLAQLCSQRNTQVVIADCLKLPYRDNCADVVICIAVIHHMSTKVRRTKAVQEIVRVLRPCGQALIYVWAFEQEGAEGPSNYLKQNKLNHQHNVLEMEQDVLKFESSEIQFNDSSTKVLKMPVHRNRTNFIQQDMLVPWKEKKGPYEVTHAKSGNVHHRYYHVFAKGELESLVTESGGTIITSYYDKGNWCVLLEK
ncbi:alkylated DNA repair protein alkB homolog 8-like, partial [Stegodyphus dumicola]|uniref:alkylated DNA repair protein alkB homolog 8-like n=1 Tax=Stegodyphus dumicola TaxID=202533 RepID=UPI0015B1EC8A